METSNLSHVIKLVDRKNIVISGIKRIINFDDKEFSLESVMGDINIKGSELEMIKLDTIDGNVSIKGNIDCIDYIDGQSSGDKLLSKLFKWVNLYIWY